MVAMWMACDWAWDTVAGTKEQDLDRYSDPARPRMVSTLPHVARAQAVHDRSSVARALAAASDPAFHFPAESQAREKPAEHLDRDSGYAQTVRLSIVLKGNDAA